MCLIAVAWQAHPRFELVVAANRDEFHARPTVPAAPAPDDPRAFGGRDALHGGGWLQVHASGRLAAVTNVRAGPVAEVAPRTRGALVHAFVRDPGAAWATLGAHGHEFGRFNLLAWDGAALHYASNHPASRREPVAPGVHGLSNADLDAPWPKVLAAQSALSSWLADPASTRAQPGVEPLFAALADVRVAPESRLPDTGVGRELERMLSAPFILGDVYGTRCSTVVLVEATRIHFHERRFGAGGKYAGHVHRLLERAP